MNKILDFFKRPIFCISSRTNPEMVNLSPYSPRVKTSELRKQVDAEEKAEKADDASPSKARSAGRPKGKKRSKRKGGEADSLRATRGSLGTMSLLQTPKAPGVFPLPVGFSSRGKLQQPNGHAPLKSPPVETLSVDTPERSAPFHKNIFNVTECKLRVLGKGSFGTIIQATYKGELVAAKIVPPHKASSLKNELNNFLLSHPNIVKTLRIISNEENGSCGLVIMEMCSSFTLEHLSSEDSYSLDTKSIVRYMTDVGSALEHCHRQKVLHLDVKPRNVLVNVTTNLCKLCDFGSSCLFSEGEATNDRADFKTLQSTVVYTSPELLTGGFPTDKSDVYSFGITLWQLVHREKPYVVDNKIDLQSTIYKIVKQKKRPQKKTKTDGALEKIYTACWDHEPEKRPTMREVLQFLKSIPTT